MTILDWAIIITYLAGLIVLSIYLSRGQKDQEDYYIAGRNIPWWAAGLSTMATQTSAISFISVPAFVALAEGGGLTWLQYELAVPIAMIVVMVFLLPFFHKLELVSVYEYLELRFGPSVRTLISAIFLLSRGLATGVAVYAAAIVLSVMLQIPLWATILLMGGITLIYDVIGGISVVIWSDVIQMGILLAGLAICVFFAADTVGGFQQIFAAMPDERLNAFDPATGLSGNGGVPFWAFLFGGFFLYISYYGVDQSQVQQELSVESEHASKKSLMLNGLARFPLTLLYALLGIAVFAVYQQSPELAAIVPPDNPDFLVPQYIYLMLPQGVRALLLAALLAAAMSSLDTALNSLSASTMRDFVNKWSPSTGQNITVSKLTTFFWGIAVTGFAFGVGSISDTVIEAINKIGSAFYGPILAAFLIGILMKRIRTRGVLTGIITGTALNLFLWIFHPEIHWMWWNLTGCITAVAAAYITGLTGKSKRKINEEFGLSWPEIVEREKDYRMWYLLLIGYFGFILGIILLL